MRPQPPGLYRPLFCRANAPLLASLLMAGLLLLVLILHSCAP